MLVCFMIPVNSLRSITPSPFCLCVCVSCARPSLRLTMSSVCLSVGSVLCLQIQFASNCLRRWRCVRWVLTCAKRRCKKSCHNTTGHSALLAHAVVACCVPAWLWSVCLCTFQYLCLCVCVPCDAQTLLCSGSHCYSLSGVVRNDTGQIKYADFVDIMTEKVRPLGSATTLAHCRCAHDGSHWCRFGWFYPLRLRNHPLRSN